MSERTAEVESPICDDLPRVICFHTSKVEQLRAALPGEVQFDRAAASPSSDESE